ncbi:MAG: hypothetical protein Q7V88_11440 [Actinomycetota bacterium]|nr:hypothetical protein [Actinomycetota bacterium]
MDNHPTGGQDGVVAKHVAWRQRRPAVVIGVLAACTVLTGVLVYADRTEHAVMGDGEVAGSGVVIMGLLVLVLPIALASYRAMRMTPAMAPAICLASIGAGLVTAMGRPGNLFVVGFFATSFVALGYLRLVGWAEHRALRKQTRLP